MKVLHATIMIVSAIPAVGANAQTARTSKDTTQAYGARLLDPADNTATLNIRRTNNRINNRLPGRISTRIEKYSVEASADPAAALRRTDPSSTQAIVQAGKAARQESLPEASQGPKQQWGKSDSYAGDVSR